MALPLLAQVMVLLALDLVLIVPAMLVAWWLLGEQRAAFATFLVAVASLAVSYLMSFLYRHPAPYQVGTTILTGAPENSFPSQHAAVVFALALGLAWWGLRRSSLGALAAALLVSAGRVYVGLHYPIDIVGGFVAAVVGTLLVALAGPALVEVPLAPLLVVDRRIRAWWRGRERAGSARP